MDKFSEQIAGNKFSSPHYIFTLGLTMFFTAIGFFWPEVIELLELPMLIAVVILVGIPHGATDHLMAKAIFPDKYRMSSFLFIYTAIMTGYLILWYFIPVISLLIFLLIAAYHFGQSQLLYLKLGHHHPLKILHYLVWGSYVLLNVLLLNWSSTWSIIGELFNIGVLNIDPLIAPIILSLLGGNILLFFIFFIRGALHQKDFIAELINLALWPLVAYFTPLLLAFAIYFGLWHSIVSIRIEQQGFSSLQKESLSTNQFFIQALPLTLATFGIYFFLIYLNEEYLIYESQYLLFFVLIAALTLAHVLVIENFYRKTLPVNKW